MRVTAEHLLHLQRQPVHAFPHIGSADRQPNPHPGRNRDHRRASTSSTRSNAAASTSRSTRTRRPPASSISISPAFLRRRRRGASLISAGLSAATGTGNAETSLVISTATKDGSSEAPGTPITPSSASRRHLYNCAGNSPCRRAIADRFAPGAVASASTANFCSTLNRRRRSMRPRTSAPRYNIDLALLLAPVPSQHPASSSRRSQGGRHRRDTKHPLRCEFGPLPLVRQMLGLALLSLVVLLGVSASAVINIQNMSRSLLELTGYPLLMVETFLVSAASLGGCFANLQRINIVVSNGTYDPRTQSTYWTRWVMGVISGIVLSS